MSVINKNALSFILCSMKILKKMSTNFWNTYFFIFNLKNIMQVQNLTNRCAKYLMDSCFGYIKQKIK